MTEYEKEKQAAGMDTDEGPTVPDEAELEAQNFQVAITANLSAVGTLEC